MKEYRKEQQGLDIILWDDEAGIGLKFKEGESLQKYTSEVILKDDSILSTEDGIKLLDEVTEQIRAKAEELYPKEFRELA